jgi:hypothetical protein
MLAASAREPGPSPVEYVAYVGHRLANGDRPNAEGHRLLGEGIAKHVLAMLERKEATGAASSGK